MIIANFIRFEVTVSFVGIRDNYHSVSFGNICYRDKNKSRSLKNKIENS